MRIREIEGSILQCPGPGWEFVEGEYVGKWVEKEGEGPGIRNPYRSTVKKQKKYDGEGYDPDKGDAAKDQSPGRFIRRRKAPDEKGYTWSMGYNNLTGRYTQGSLFPEMTGSSLNRKTYAKDIPAKDDDIIALADKASEQYHRAGGHPIVEWEGRREYLGLLPEIVRDKITAGDRGAAFRLAVWISETLRKLRSAVSYGIHVLSARSRGKIKDKATAFFRACPGSRVFATLTFIDAVGDKSAVSILNTFLTQARKKFTGLQYFWVAERQDGTRNERRGVQKEATGNVHFHMILNRRLPVGRWNALWAMAQYNAGLRGHDQYGNEISKEQLVRAFQLDHAEGYINKRVQGLLNPFDIKKVRTIAKLSSYLTKYITKQEKNKPFGCATWHCSRGVSRVFTRQTVGPSAFAYMKSFANYGVDKRTGEVWAEPQEYKCGNGFAVVIFANDKAAPLRYLKRMEQVNKWILEGFQIDRLPMLDDDLFKKMYICKN